MIFFWGILLREIILQKELLQTRTLCVPRPGCTNHGIQLLDDKKQSSSSMNNIVFAFLSKYHSCDPQLARAPQPYWGYSV